MDNPQEGFVFRPTRWYNDSMKLSPEYIAGFIDGEGYLGLYSHSAFKNSLVPAVKIAQVESGKTTLEAIQASYGGHIGFRNSRQARHQNSYQWELKSKRTIKLFLEDILPFLVVKRQQAELLLEYCNLPPRHPLYATKVTLQRGIEIHDELLRLKRPLATTE